MPRDRAARRYAQDYAWQDAAPRRPAVQAAPAADMAWRRPTGTAPDPAQETAPSPERDELATKLSEHGGDVEAVAEAMGISRSQLYRRAQKLGIRVSDFKR